MPWSILNAAHGVGRVAEEIQNDLLKLNAVSLNSGKMVAEFIGQNYVVSLQFAGTTFVRNKLIIP